MKFPCFFFSIKGETYATLRTPAEFPIVNEKICVFRSQNKAILTLAGGLLGRVKTFGHYYKIIATSDTSFHKECKKIKKLPINEKEPLNGLIDIQLRTNSGLGNDEYAYLIPLGDNKYLIEKLETNFIQDLYSEGDIIELDGYEIEYVVTDDDTSFEILNDNLLSENENIDKLISSAWTWLAKRKTIYAGKEKGDCFTASDVLFALKIVASQISNK